MIINKWIKSKGEEETKILRLKGKVENFSSLHLLQSEISQVFKFPKAPMDAKNLKRKTKHDLDENAINKN
jgi:hypothetical protein